MSSDPQDEQDLVGQEGGDLADVSTLLTSTTIPHQRHGYHRMTSQGSPDLPSDQSQPIVAMSQMDGEYGLGIIGVPKSINRVPVGSRTSPKSPSSLSSKPYTPLMASNSSPMIPETPGSSTAFLSPVPAWQRYDFGISQSSIHKTDEQDASKGTTSLNDSIDISYDVSDQQGCAGVEDSKDHRHLLEGCPTARDIHSSRTSWLSISILMLSIYSTIFSGIWLMLAIVQPRYGRTIHSGGSVTPSTASTLFALFAKTIELSFVTVFVTFLGQVISRRSLVKASRGVTITELTMRTWVIQPGFMITHWQNIQKGGATILGVITLTAAVVATFYTTASDALVSPHLKYGHWEHKMMEGLVEASYANPSFIADSCNTPIQTTMDPQFAASTCLSIEHAGQAHHNFLAYLGTWASIAENGEGVSSNLAERPSPVASLYDNTTVIGSWVATNQSNMTASYVQHERTINNVTMSLPHAGVVSAAHDPRNGILQPEDLAGLGEYSIRAAVISPSVNVLCVNMNETELSPLVYTLFPNAIQDEDEPPDVQLLPGQSYLNTTVVDDIFNWGTKYGRQPPIFPKLPTEYNSLHNISVPESDSIYILFNSSTVHSYAMCQLRSFTSPVCSTRYNVSGTSQATLYANCEDSDDRDAYDQSVHPAPLIKSGDWRNVASQWSLSVSMNAGLTDSDSSVARLLSQLIVTTPDFSGNMKLNPLMPSVSEALAVMVGNTLLLSTMGSTYFHFWNYTSTTLDPGTYLQFNSSISSQEYTSGILQKWQGIFYVVLLIVFVANIFCLVYFFLRSGLVTDYTEPQNLFALAVNSPPSDRLRGSCGAGPEKDQLDVPFHVSHEDNSNHFFIKENDRALNGYQLRRRERHKLHSISTYSRLSSKRRSYL